MPQKGNAPNYTELVYHFLRDAHVPQTLDQILAGVEGLAPIHVANPRALVLNIVEQSSLILPLPGDRYGYLPHLLAGNVFRQPLTAAAGEQGFVELSPDAIAALWPGWVEAQRQHEPRPAELALPDGHTASLRRHFRLAGHWGFTAGAEFWAWLAAEGVQPADELVIQVVDADARSYNADWVRHAERDTEAIVERNRTVADLAVGTVREAGGEILIDRLAPLLIAAGAYANPLPPDPLTALLAQDGRFVDAGLGAVALLEGWTANDERLADMRQRAMYEAIGVVRPRFRCQTCPPNTGHIERDTFARLMMDGRMEDAVDWLQRENRIHTDEEGAVTVDLHGLLEDLPDATEEGHDE